MDERIVVSGRVAFGAAICFAAAICTTGPVVRSHNVRPGVLVERVVSASDTTQSCAIYLPSRYVDSRDWQILFLLEPRGRALVPMRLFGRTACATPYGMSFDMGGDHALYTGDAGQGLWRK